MFWVKSSWTFKNIQELKNRNISSRQDAFTSMQVKIYDMYKLYNISLGNLKTLTFLSPEHDVTLFVNFYPRNKFCSVHFHVRNSRRMKRYQTVYVILRNSIFWFKISDLIFVVRLIRDPSHVLNNIDGNGILKKVLIPF